MVQLVTQVEVFCLLSLSFTHEKLHLKHLAKQSFDPRSHQNHSEDMGQSSVLTHRVFVSQNPPSLGERRVHFIYGGTKTRLFWRQFSLLTVPLECQPFIGVFMLSLGCCHSPCLCAPLLPVRVCVCVSVHTSKSDIWWPSELITQASYNETQNLRHTVSHVHTRENMLERQSGTESGQDEEMEGG